MNNEEDWQRRIAKILRDFNDEKDRLRLMAAGLDPAERTGVHELIQSCSISATMKLGTYAVCAADLAQHGERWHLLEEAIDDSPVLRRARVRINYDEQDIHRPSWEAQFITQRLVAEKTHATHTLHAVRAETLPALIELANKSLDAVRDAFKSIGYS